MKSINTNSVRSHCYLSGFFIKSIFKNALSFMVFLTLLGPTFAMEETKIYPVYPFPQVGPIVRDLTSHSVTVMGQGNVPDRKHFFSHGGIAVPNTGLASLIEYSKVGKVRRTIFLSFSMPV